MSEEPSAAPDPTTPDTASAQASAESWAPAASFAPRCLNCGYVLVGLPENRCPECGRPFDPHNPSSYSIKPPFVRWRYWLPGWLFALATGLFGYCLIVNLSGWGAAAIFVLPFCVGAVLGYGVRVRWLTAALLVATLLTGLLFGLFTMQMVGILCGLMLAGIILGPLLIGLLCGIGLRLLAKKSHFSQRWHLPVLVLLLLPPAASLIERLIWTPPSAESVQTSIVVPAPIDKAWRAMGFYEQVGGAEPAAFRLPAMPRLLSVSGGIGHVGQQTVCVYDKGRLVKEVTAREENKLLAFRVVEQGFERHSMTLVGGSFRFEPIDARHTRITLETSYRPHLSPRWCWRPFEAWTVHTLHGHVLEGMQANATRFSTSDTPAIDDAAAPRIVDANGGRP